MVVLTGVVEVEDELEKVHIGLVLAPEDEVTVVEAVVAPNTLPENILLFVDWGRPELVAGEAVDPKRGCACLFRSTAVVVVEVAIGEGVTLVLVAEDTVLEENPKLGLTPPNKVDSKDIEPFIPTCVVLLEVIGLAGFVAVVVVVVEG